MDVSTLENGAVLLKNGANTVLCSISFPDKDVDPQDDSRFYARIMRLSPENGFVYGDEYRVSITDDAAAYNGRTLQEYESEALKVKTTSVTVRFVDYDNRLISEATYHYGQTVELPEEPTRASDNVYEYKFKNWTPEVTEAAGDVTYKAVYTAEYINYTVKFTDHDGTVISEKTYYYNFYIHLVIVDISAELQCLGT